MTAYEVICPQCGCSFQIQKGATVRECVEGRHLLMSRDESEPDYCPKCHHQISVNDPDFQKHVKTYMMID